MGDVYGLECRGKMCLSSKVVVGDTFQMSMASLNLEADMISPHTVEWAISPTIPQTYECHLLKVMLNVVVCKCYR